MTNPDEARTRRDAADKRTDSADHIRQVGSFMMIAGGLLLGMAGVAFAGFDSTELPSWERQFALTLVAMLWIGGLAFYVGGQILRGTLGQLADDRAERAEQHDDVMTELRQVKRNQSFLMARPGAGGTASDANVTYRVKESPRALQAEEPEGRAPERDVVDPRYLADMSEAVRLGEELAKRKLKPPDQISN